MPKKKPPQPFSAGKAVRANARNRVGQPKAARVIPEKPAQGSRQSKHKQALAVLMTREENQLG